MILITYFNMKKGSKVCSIGFITTDDLQGIYLSWDCDTNTEAHYEWGNEVYSEFLYQLHVDIVDSCK